MSAERASAVVGRSGVAAARVILRLGSAPSSLVEHAWLAVDGLDWMSDDPRSPFRACFMNCTSSFAIVSCSNCLSKSAVSLSRSVELRTGMVSAPQSVPRCLASVVCTIRFSRMSKLVESFAMGIARDSITPAYTCTSVSIGSTASSWARCIIIFEAWHPGVMRLTIAGGSPCSPARLSRFTLTWSNRERISGCWQRNSFTGSCRISRVNTFWGSSAWLWLPM
mmetsp:Transcript_131346/g.227359  ORF Transcript_131346/g.227359 Transcript_131346/m.227359 type:complete len:223 (-) Transcript_131346:996-1664(-)